MRTTTSQPPEARGLRRDGVRLLVATPDGLAHVRFVDLRRFLAPGDLLVVNTSATVAAAVDGHRADGRPVTVHFSTPLEDGTWLVELREDTAARRRVTDAEPGDRVSLPGAASVSLLHRHPDPAADRLWVAALAGRAADDLMAKHGRPIRYSYVPDPWPLSAYQTVFAAEPGSAEMPSAGRPFSGGLVASLVAAGVVFAPITLHAGVASLEAGEAPLPERLTVPEPTARLVNATRAAGGRVIAVGTTVTRALESAAEPSRAGRGGGPGRTDPDGTDPGVVRGMHGWTDLVLGPDRPARVVTGLITGWHDPEASHLALLEAVAGPELVRAAYQEADKDDYLGHEFGDSCLLLPLM